MTTYILSFEQISSADIGMVGGKGANLGEMAQAGFNVPSGFCVTTEAFAGFIESANATLTGDSTGNNDGNNAGDIYTRLEDISADELEELRAVGNATRMALSRVSLPDDIVAAILAAWRNAGEEHAYAVRSSATAEDLPSASFAGQQDTYLNVRGQDDLLKSVRDCFISLFTDRAILYRVQNGFDHRDVALSVVVQRMVQPTVSGILFTADPVTGNRNVASIDASFGLGEALVSGLVSADLYQVDKQTNQIIKQQIADKKIAIRSLADGGTEQVDLAVDERQMPALTDEQVLALSKLGSQIENHYGTPQDIEWALADGDLYVTQSRPITSLFPLPEPKPTDDALYVYVSLSHFQVMTDAMPPLALSLWRALLPMGHAEGQIESKYVHTAGGRFYADFSPILRHPLGRRLLPRVIMNGDELAAGALALLAERPELPAKGERIQLLRLLPIALPIIFKVVRNLFWAKHEDVPNRMLTLMDADIAALKNKLNALPDLQDRVELVTSAVRQAIPLALKWVPQMVAGMVAMSLVNKLLKKKAGPKDLAALGAGLSGNVTTNMGLAVGDLTDAARASEPLMVHLSQLDIDARTRLAGVADLPGGEDFLREWEHFMDRYGTRGPAEIDLSRPRWSEDPSSLLQMVVSGLGNASAGAHQKHYQQLVAENRTAADTLRKVGFLGALGWIRGPLIRRLIYVAQNLMPLREHHKFMMVRIFGLAKPVLLEAGEVLQSEGKLEHGEDVWFLTLPEIAEALGSLEEKWRECISERQSAFEHYQQLKPPRVITSTGEIPVVKLAGVGAPEGALIGSPVSAGVVEGVAKVVLDPSTEALKPGEILVAPFTDPGWTPLFVNAAGLITEVGGLMTHGSVVAREYGIPAVVGVVDATTEIKTGQRIRVHGDAGYVEFISGDNTP